MPIWLRAGLFILVFPGTLAGWLPRYIAGPIPGMSRPPIHVVGAAMVLAGWVVLLYCARDFAYSGRGTPAPYDPPRALVTTHLYRFVRNPMYVGLLGAVTGFALWYWSASVAIYAACLAMAFHLRVLMYEEPRLRAAFGSDYADYCARVPRWLPRLR
jgi:protein-S-isoprenylcysteine O-methyltransferase Ste14